jgi:hypothetical protein
VKVVRFREGKPKVIKRVVDGQEETPAENGLRAYDPDAMPGRHTISVTRSRTTLQSGDVRSQRTLWSDRKITSALFVGVLVIYVAVLRGKAEVEDTRVMLAVTKNLVNHGSLRTPGAGYPLAPFATPWSPYGIAVSILAVPAYLMSLWIGHFGVVVSLVDPLLTACCVVLIYRIARALNWNAF